MLEQVPHGPSHRFVMHGSRRGVQPGLTSTLTIIDARTQAGQSLAQRFLIHAIGDLGGPGNRLWVWRGRGLWTGLTSLDPALLDLKLANAAPPQMCIHPLNEDGAHVLQIEAKTSRHADSEGRRFNRRVGRALGATWRPDKAQRLGHGGEPRTCNIVPVQDQIRLAKALFGHKRVHQPGHKIGKRL